MRVKPKGEGVYPSNTEYYAPTVTIRSVNNVEMLKLKLQGAPILLNSGKLSPNSQAYTNLSSNLNMEASKKNALAASIAYNGGVKSESDVVISNIDEGGKGYSSGLRIGMSIYKVNGERVNNPDDFLKMEKKSKLLVIETIKPTRTIRINYNNASLGLTLITAPITKLPSIDVGMSKIGGSSAGLVMALAIYDALNPNDLTNLKKVSGSGSITPDGRVYPITGIDEKLKTAENEGVEVFFIAKNENYRYKALRMRVIRVSNLSEAIAYLSNR
jgi:PDZ domain-containing protein